jgi:hypothetical protein
MYYIYYANFLQQHSNESTRSDPASVKLNAESERLLNEASRCRFRLDQVFAEGGAEIASASAVCSMGDDFLLLEMEVWELIGTMAGSLSQCLVRYVQFRDCNDE